LFSFVNRFYYLVIIFSAVFVLPRRMKLPIISKKQSRKYKAAPMRRLWWNRQFLSYA